MHVILSDVSGAIHRTDSVTYDEMLNHFEGDAAELTDQIQEMVTLFSRFKQMTHLNLEIDGLKTWFNPDNVVWIRIENFDEFAEKTGITL